jgi:carbon-monoxide dehydrogenase medium subunit
MSHAIRRERTGYPQAKRLMVVSRIPDLLAITNKNNGLQIGSAVNQQTLIERPELRERWTVLAESLDAAGHTRVRGMTTVGGSIGPLIGGFDMPVALVALNARVVTAAVGGRNTYALTEAFDKRFAKDEMLIAVEIDALPARSGSAFHKFLPRGVMETPTANAAAVVTLDASGKCIAARLVVGAVSWKPLVADLSALVGKSFDEAAIRAAVKPLRELAQPMANVRGSAMYKRNMAVEIGARTLIRAWQRAAQQK